LKTNRLLVGILALVLILGVGFSQNSYAGPDALIMENLRLTDSSGQTKSSPILTIELPVQIVADISNPQDRDQSFFYLVEITSGGLQVPPILSISGSLTAGQSFSPSIQWTPSSGSYQIKAQVFDGILKQNPLAPELLLDVIIEEVPNNQVNGLCPLIPGCATGNLYVADGIQLTVRQYDNAGTLLDATFITGLNEPVSIAFDSAGKLYVLDNNLNTVRQYNSAGGLLDAFFITGLSDPTSIAFDSNGFLYVADAGFDTVRLYDSAGDLLNANFITGLLSPSSIAFDSAGKLYVLDSFGTSAGFDTVRKYSNAGDLLDASFITGLTSARSIAFDSNGELYVADSGKVEQYDSTGTLLEADFAPGTTGITSIAFDSNGLLYVVDFPFLSSNKVRQYDSTGGLLDATFITGLSFPLSIAFDFTLPKQYEISVFCESVVTSLSMNFVFFHRDGVRIENQVLLSGFTCPPNSVGTALLLEVPNGIDFGILAEINGQPVLSRFCNLDGLPEPPNFIISFEIDPNTGEVFCVPGISSPVSSIASMRVVPIETPSDSVIGGSLLPIDTTALLLAGAQSFSWMIPVVLSGIGIGLFVVSRKSENLNSK